MKVIDFEPVERLLARARRYVEAPETFLANVNDATRVLLRALKHADSKLRLRIEMLVGVFGDKNKLVEPLHGILRDGSETEDARHEAAIQLSVIAERLTNPQELVRRLIADAESEDAELRLHATCALGWAGNRDAVLPLLERLHDSDDRIRQTAVFALTNLRDDRVLGVLLDRLDVASGEQQRAILFNLWRFYARQRDAAGIYFRFVGHADPDLRFDALVLLGQVSDVAEYVEVYRGRLCDPDERLRRHALEVLSSLPSSNLQEMRDEITVLLDDPNMDVKRLALRVLQTIGPSAGP